MTALLIDTAMLAGRIARAAEATSNDAKRNAKCACIAMAKTVEKSTRPVSNPPASCELTGGPNRGDHLGYFATGLIAPGAPNVTVPHAAAARFDFTLGVFP